VPEPTCKSQDYKLTSLDGITSNTKYLGDASKSNWVASGQALTYNNQVLLTLAPDSVGTLLASAAYVWYGKVSATLKTSRGAGVVTAFILLSDVKDEIDFEFVGADLKTAQSNYYHQGITDCMSLFPFQSAWLC
jgi:beta-glucanase (GH16 family)